VNVPDAVERTCVQYVVAMFILPDGLPRGLGFLDGDKDVRLAKRRAVANDVPKEGGITVPDAPVQMLAKSRVLSPVKGGGHVPVPNQAKADRQRKRLTEVTESMQQLYMTWLALGHRVAANKRAEGETLTEEEKALLRQEVGDDEVAAIEEQMDAADEEGEEEVEGEGSEEDTDEGGSTDVPADEGPRTPVRSPGAAKRTPGAAKRTPGSAKRKAEGGTASGVKRGRGKQRGARGGGGGVQRSVTDFFARAGEPDAA